MSITTDFFDAVEAFVASAKVAATDAIDKGIEALRAWADWLATQNSNLAATKTFSADDPARHAKCLAELKALETTPPVATNHKGAAKGPFLDLIAKMIAALIAALGL